MFANIFSHLTGDMVLIFQKVGKETSQKDQYQWKITFNRQNKWNL